MVSAAVKNKRKSPSGELLGTMWKPPCLITFTDSASGQSRFRTIHSCAHDGQPSQNMHKTMSLEETNLKGSKSTLSDLARILPGFENLKFLMF